jgi:hypothetical protein
VWIEATGIPDWPVAPFTRPSSLISNMFIVDLILGSLFTIWFTLSVVNQFSFQWFDRVLEFDYFSLIPYWTFFAPNPGRTDYHVVYRDKRPDGSTTNWREVVLTEPRGLASVVWNPKKRSKKVLSDVAMSIARIVRANPATEQFVIVSFQYLLILNYLVKSVPSSTSVERQFAIVETAGFYREGPPSVVLRSDFHSIGVLPSLAMKAPVPT